MQAVRASVKPHVTSPTTGEVLALEDAVASWIERDARGLILVSGDAGSGRTTAIRHLAAVLPPEPHLRFVDHCETLPDAIDVTSIGDLLVVVSTDDAGERKRSVKHLLAEYRLAKWTMDDRIDYLLSCWPDRCGSVIARLKQADLHRCGESDLLEGCPAVWKVALDRMAEDEAVSSAVDAILDEIAKLVGSPEQLSALQDFCLTVAAKRPLPATVPGIRESRGEVVRLTAPSGIMLRLAAAGVIASLKGPSEPRELSPPLPVSILAEVAAGADECVLSRLKSIIDDVWLQELHASAAGILLKADPHWLPDAVHAKLILGHAVLDSAEWEGIELQEAVLSRASLVNANLSASNLAQARADYADFRSADLREANLERLDGVHATLYGADLSAAIGPKAYFTFARFQQAKLDNARFKHANFRGADFRRASLQGVCFEAANLRHVLVEDADFRHAILDSAKLDHVILSKANVRGASFRRASLQQCDLECIDPGFDADFRLACLFGAHLTGAQLPKARMEGADLRATGLADINLECADLRGVLFDGATFHMGSSRSGLVDSPLASEGTRTGFYTDEYEEQHYRDPAEFRKANLCRADLRGAKVKTVDFYLVDLRGAIYDEDQRRHFECCGAILD